MADMNISTGLTNDFKQTLVQGLVTATAIILFFLVLLGPLAQRSSHPVLALFFGLANAFSFNLLTYAISKAEEVPGSNLLMVWAVLLQIISIKVGSSSTNPYEDDEKRGSVLVSLFADIVWVAFLIFKSIDPGYRIAVWSLWGASTAKMALGIIAYLHASRSFSLSKNARFTGDYMVQLREEEEKSAGPGEGQGNYNASTMAGYKYIVMGEDNQQVIRSPLRYELKLTRPDELVTVEKVWACPGPLLKNSVQLKDLCLSFAFFKLLRRRTRGYPLAEAGSKKARDLVVIGLLRCDNPDEHDHERVFKIVEKEINFLREFTFSNHPVTYTLWFQTTNAVLFIVLLVSCCLILMRVDMLSMITIDADRQHLIDLGWRREVYYVLNVIVTTLVMILIIIMESVDIITFLLSDCLKVSILCQYVKNRSWHGNRLTERLIEAHSKLKLFGKPWDRKLGQYHFIRDFHTKKPWTIYFRLTFGFIGSANRVELSEDVKKAVVEALRRALRNSNNGTSVMQQPATTVFHSERLGNIRQLLMLDMGKEEPYTQTILVWHIATTLCKNLTVDKGRQWWNINKLPWLRYDGDNVFTSHTSSDETVALTLAMYCGYLIAYLPSIIPDDNGRPTYILKNAVQEAEECLKDHKYLHERIEFIMKTKHLNQESMLAKSSELAKVLMREIELDGEETWKELAEIWADMLVKLAPSEDHRVHIERLGKGGELITLIWALLTHAGIPDGGRLLSKSSSST